MKIPVAIKILSEATGPKANVEFMDVSVNQVQLIPSFLFCFASLLVLHWLILAVVYAVKAQVIEKIFYPLSLYFIM